MIVDSSTWQSADGAVLTISRGFPRPPEGRQLSRKTALWGSGRAAGVGPVRDPRADDPSPGGERTRESQRRFAAAMALLQETPGRARPGLDIHPLRGLKGMWRLRVGEFRGIYQREGSTIIFTQFAHRSSVY